jgi:D-alanine transaminase
MTARIFLNGRWLPPEEARVPVMDRGFLFGDGVYEVIPVYSRRPFRLEQHLQRLQKSLDGIQLANPHGTEEWIGFVTQLAAGAEWEDQSIYIQVTRGPMAVRNHAFPKEVVPTSVIRSPSRWSRRRPVSANRASPPCPRPTSAGCAATSRPLRCWPTACCARWRWLAGCVETVLFRDGFLTEGSASNDLCRQGRRAAGADQEPPDAARHHLRRRLRTRRQARPAARSARHHRSRDARRRRTLDVLLDQGSAAHRAERQAGRQGSALAATPGPLFAKMYAWYQEFKAKVMRGA